MKPLLTMLLCTSLFPALAHAQNDAPVVRSQNPSPMMEETRVHGRIPNTVQPGVRDSAAGPLGRMVQLFVPAAARGAQQLNLIIHFHGNTAVSEYAAAQLGHNHMIAIVQLGSGSELYDRTFRAPQVFDSLLAVLRRTSTRMLGHDVAFKTIVLSGWSAGHGAIRAIVRDSAHAELVDAILLLDGLHTGYVPERTVIAEGGQLDTSNFTSLLRYARWAMQGRKRMLITHSEIFPGTFASTTESASYMIHALGLARRPLTRKGPLGMIQTSATHSGRFEVRSFAGNSAPDHVDHLHALDVFLRALERL